MFSSTSSLSYVLKGHQIWAKDFWENAVLSSCLSLFLSRVKIICKKKKKQGKSSSLRSRQQLKLLASYQEDWSILLLVCHYFSLSNDPEMSVSFKTRKEDYRERASDEAHVVSFLEVDKKEGEIWNVVCAKTHLFFWVGYSRLSLQTQRKGSRMPSIWLECISYSCFFHITVQNVRNFF